MRGGVCSDKIRCRCSVRCVNICFAILDSVRYKTFIFDIRPAAFALQSLTAHRYIGDKYIVPGAAHFSPCFFTTNLGVKIL